MYVGLSLDDPRLKSTAEQVEKRILNTSPIGGAIRYEFDNYFLTKRNYKGNPWAVTTLWMAQYYAIAGRQADAKKLLDWTLHHQISSGALSEQFDPESTEPLGVTPLVWSHAELINTILDLSGEKQL